MGNWFIYAAREKSAVESAATVSGARAKWLVSAEGSGFGGWSSASFGSFSPFLTTPTKRTCGAAGPPGPLAEFHVADLGYSTVIVSVWGWLERLLAITCGVNVPSPA